MTALPIFDRAYYDAIWPGQGVHRHDYCESLAASLVAQYGKCRILDAGTGCGYLVKLLRERGCDAWGLDVSEYAFENRCDPHIWYSDIRDARVLSTGYFDVIHSQGLWEYIPEADVPRAIAECKRIGRIQHHTIDYLGSGVGEEGFATAKPREWWNEQFKLQGERLYA